MTQMDEAFQTEDARRAARPTARPRADAKRQAKANRQPTAEKVSSPPSVFEVSVSVMPIVSVQPAVSVHIAAITRIYGHAVRHGTASFELDAPDEAEMARRQEALIAGGYPYLVAQADGEVLGYAYAGPYRRGQRTASPSRIRCTSHRTRSGAALADFCSIGSSPNRKRATIAR